MPWFGAIQDGHERLDTAEAGVWSSVSDAHRDLRLAPRIPSGSACHVYAVNPYSLPGIAQLTGLGPISDALLGRIKWHECKILSSHRGTPSLLLIAGTPSLLPVRTLYNPLAVLPFVAASELLTIVDIHRVGIWIHVFLVELINQSYQRFPAGQSSDFAQILRISSWLLALLPLIRPST
ncbi:uncharacterized protein N7483_006775 [Penicillium malachiteum]|uniref:uncharacterized protein n=1 Tax=Penicillium malachiteum TaxID=1324776 RepID=UPI00254693CF|nr:uncharacterized protein N7483_006775 [Penicillium malachiteum]KAJ5725418.1 hypothetical protein N7483_006775 [Penicillium malachiteum]